MASIRDFLGTSRLSWLIGKARLDASGLTAARTLVLPDAAGTVALTGHSHVVGDVTSLQAVLDAKLGSAGLRNAVINGCCRVSHRSSKGLSTSWQYAEVDLIAVKAEGTVSAGTIRQVSGVSSLATSGNACLVQGATLGSGGAIGWRHRIEARDAVKLANGAAVISARVYHDVGAAISYSVTVNKANATDDFSAVTQIASGASSIANDSNADLGLAVGNLGDCSTGLELLIKASCGAVSGRNFYLGDLQLEAGSVRTSFERRPLAAEAALVGRFLRPCVIAGAKANSGSNLQAALAHPEMRVTPAYEVTAALSFTDCVTADFTQSQPDLNTVHERTPHDGRVSCGYFSGLSSGTTLVKRGAGGIILASAEL